MTVDEVRDALFDANSEREIREDAEDCGQDFGVSGCLCAPGMCECDYRRVIEAAIQRRLLLRLLDEARDGRDAARRDIVAEHGGLLDICGAARAGWCWYSDGGVVELVHGACGYCRAAYPNAEVEE